MIHVNRGLRPYGRSYRRRVRNSPRRSACYSSIYTASEPSDEDHDDEDEESERGRGCRLVIDQGVIADEPAAAPQPTEGALNHPATRVDGEALLPSRCARDRGRDRGSLGELRDHRRARPSALCAVGRAAPVPPHQPPLRADVDHRYDEPRLRRKACRARRRRPVDHCASNCLNARRPWRLRRPGGPWAGRRGLTPVGGSLSSGY